MNLIEVYLQSLAVRDDLPDETREYVEAELEKEKGKDDERY